MTGLTPVPTLPTDGTELSVEQARLVGRQLAEHPLLAARAGDERPGVAEVLNDARPLLSTYGISFEVVRTRPGFIVLRSRPDAKVHPLIACELVKSLLAEVTEQVCDIQASLVENSCIRRGAPACLYSMVWESAAIEPNPQATQARLAPPSPETLIDPEPGEPDRFLDADTAVDADYELPDWNRPVSGSDPTEDPIVDLDEPAEEIPDAILDAVEPVPTPQPTVSSAISEPIPPPTAASSTAHHYQVSTPNAIVVPTPVAPLRSPAPVAPAAAPAPIPDAVDSMAPSRSITTRRSFPKGLIRRSWLLVIALVAGSAGGWFAGVHAGTSYGAQATLVVQSGAGHNGPGSANDALALATTYSALIPKDQSILSAAAGTLKMTSAAVAADLTVSVENGTSILLVQFTAPSAARAVAGADAVARAVASNTPVTAAIASGSVAIVNVPSAAHLQGTLHKYGIVFGGFLGVVLGLILVLTAERADPRVDDAASMATASGCRAALVPADLSFAELARVLADVGHEKGGGLTIVPITISDTAPTMELARGLRPCWPSDGPAVAISPSFSSGVVELSKGTGPTVLVSHPGTRQREIVAAADRLRMIGRAPVWAVLANRRLRSRVPSRVG